MKKLYVTLILFLLSNFVFGQNPLVKQWDKRFGGTESDGLHIFKQTSDGGYVLLGGSNSNISGDKTQNTWGSVDFWIVKIDSLGNMQWNKDFGGTDGDVPRSLQQTSDGGYIIGGNSFSDISGDKTQPNWDTSGNSADYWIVKIDPLGSKQWDKDFGGTKGDGLYSLQQTSDGGYILGGQSWSGISGDKTQPNWDTSGITPDYWIVKTDSLGNKQWDKVFGGTEKDYFFSLQQTSDGGYILGGWSGSGINGDKTQSTWMGSADYWLVKIDSLGGKQWDKDLGGNSDDFLRSLQKTNDGGYILGGYSWSGIGGDKTQSTWGELDYWIVKTDSQGNKQWDKNFGGVFMDQMLSLYHTKDGGYLITGTSESPASGDKTENNLGFSQTWIVKTDSFGNKQWDKTLLIYGSTGFGGNGIQTNDSCFVFANFNDATLGAYKTQPNWDTTNATTDYWIIKFCDTTLTTEISNFQILNSNLQISPNPFTSGISITIQKQNITQASFTIKNILGQTVYESSKFQFSNSNFQTNLDLAFLSKGIYLLEVITDGERMVKKIVKE